MGWGRMLLLGNWGQQMDIQDQKKEIEALRTEVSRQKRSTGADRIAELERENAEMRLYLAALIRYLISNGTIDLNDFRVLIDEIDRADGRHDGGYEGKVL